MAMYLGTQKVNNAAPGLKYATGTSMVTDGGELVIPRPKDFTPHTIIVWNAKRIDQWEEHGESNDYMQFLYEGIILTALYMNGEWVSQALASASGDIYLANASASGGVGDDSPDNAPPSAIYEDSSCYIYYILRATALNENSTAFSGERFNYALYG